MMLDPSWPTHPAPLEVAGHAELLAAGAYDPVPDFLDPLVLDVGEDVKTAAETAGHLVLTDDEGAPVAVFDVAADQPGSGTVAGTIRPIRGHHRALFPGLRFDPQAIRQRFDQVGAVAVTLDRPLTLAEENAVATIAAADRTALLLLPCTGSTGAAGVPVEITVRAALISAERISSHVETVVATLPLVPRPDGLPPAGSREAATAVGATLLGAGAEPSPLDHHRWTGVIATLREAVDDVPLPTQPGIAALLRRWLPPRPERGLTLFFTGLSGSGKSTVARGVGAAIRAKYDRTVTLVDGDVARRMLSAGLGFSRSDRELNIRRIGWVAAEITRHGGLAICAPIAPYAATRAEVRQMVEANGDFVLVHVATPLEVCEQRDRKGLYAKARAGIITEFTGISDPYEEPDDADVRVDTSSITVEDAVATVLGYLERHGWLRFSGASNM
jgi:sulfate adenylyltransferase